METTVTCFNKAKIQRMRSSLANQSFNDDATIYKALANAKRLEILHVLKTEACCVCDLSHILDTPVASISQYLRVLKAADLVQSERNGKFIIYSLADRAQAILEHQAIRSELRGNPQKMT